MVNLFGSFWPQDQAAAGVDYGFWEGVERLANIFRVYPAPPASTGKERWP